MKKFGLLSIVFSLLFFVYGCDTPGNNSKNLWDDIWYTKCTTEQKNAQACNLILYPVCGDDWVTYDNECFACASNEIDGYVLWYCNPSCDDESEVCSINLTEDENNLNPKELDENTSPTQEVWLELIVVNPEE